MTQPFSDEIANITIIGTGPAGLITALAFAAQSCPVTLIGPNIAPNIAADASGRAPLQDAAPDDHRTTALLHKSIKLLSSIELWARLAPYAEALKTIRIIDDTGRLIRGPELRFDASEIELEAFGYNIANKDLLRILFERILAHESITYIPTAQIIDIEYFEDHAALTSIEGAKYKTRMIAAADGRNSLCRQKAGIETTQYSHNQFAFVCNFFHQTSHANASTEFHRPHGPFTIVPLPLEENGADSRAGPYRSGLVWVEKEHEAKHIRTLSDEELKQRISTLSHGLFGDIIEIQARGLFPLAHQAATPLAAQRTALIGEAGHLFPPIGAQGLNLGIRDAFACADIFSQALKHNHDPGGDEILQKYNQERKSDVLTRSKAVDALNFSLITDFVPLQMLRAFGLHILNQPGPIRRALMRAGV